jgi:hypothetical protein
MLPYKTVNYQMLIKRNYLTGSHLAKAGLFLRSLPTTRWSGEYKTSLLLFQNIRLGVPTVFAYLRLAFCIQKGTDQYFFLGVGFH